MWVDSFNWTILSSRILQQAFVGREAVCLCVIHSNPVTGKCWGDCTWQHSVMPLDCCVAGTGLIAVGSEDCSICLLLLQPTCILHYLCLIRNYIKFLHMNVYLIRAEGHDTHTYTNSLTLIQWWRREAQSPLKSWKLSKVTSPLSERWAPPTVAMTTTDYSSPVGPELAWKSGLSQVHNQPN